MKNILIIDNDPDSSSLMKMWLEKKGYTVAYTENKNRVPDIISDFKPSIVILDVMQTETFEDIKNYDGAIPILLMAGYTNIQQYIGVPADDVIEKPFFPNILEMKIKQLLGIPELD